MHSCAGRGGSDSNPGTRSRCITSALQAWGGPAGEKGPGVLLQPRPVSSLGAAYGPANPQCTLGSRTLTRLQHAIPRDLAHLLRRETSPQPPLHLRASRGQFEKRAPGCSCRLHQPPGRTKSGLRGKPSPRRRASALAALRPGPPEDDGDPRALKRPSATAGFKRGRGLGVWWAGSEQRVGLGGRGLKEEPLPGWAGQARGEGGRAGFSWGRGLSRWAGWRAQARVFHVGLR